MNSGRLPRAQFYIGHFNRGSGYRRDGDFREALADFQKVVALKPKFARGYHARGLVYGDLGEINKALADLDQAIKLDRSEWSTYYTRAAVRRTNGDYEMALQDLKTASELKPEMTQISLLRALVLADKGAITVARAEINKTIANGHGDVPSYYARAEVAFAEKRFDAAEEELNKVLKLNPDYGVAHLLMGRVLAERGDTSAAKAQYRQALAKPVQFLETEPVHHAAQSRLDALDDGGRKPAMELKPVASSSDATDDGDKKKVAFKKEMGSGECRLYLPTTGLTVSTPCDK